MSQDLIRRNDAIVAIYEARRAMPLKGVFADTMSWAIARANAIPTIKPKRGEWVVNDIGMFECTACKKMTFSKSMLWKYCPFCGADMRKEGE